MEQLEREPTTKELATALEMEMAELSVFQSMSQPRHLVSFDEPNEHGRGEEGLSLLSGWPIRPWTGPMPRS